MVVSVVVVVVEQVQVQELHFASSFVDGSEVTVVVLEVVALKPFVDETHFVNKCSLDRVGH